MIEMIGPYCQDELYKKKISDFIASNSAVLVEIPNTRTECFRTFTTGHFYEFLQKIYRLLP